MIVRALIRGRGRRSRFFGSRTWQAVYVELTILGIVVCVIVLRGLEYQLLGPETSRLALPADLVRHPRWAGRRRVGNGIVVVAAVKIIISMAWFVTIGLNTTMGVAWHRFTVWPNIWFKREPSGRPALGASVPDHHRRPAGGLRRDRGSGRRCQPRRGQGRGLHLEGAAGLHLLHRVRSVPVPVPGLEHREAAVAQAADHGAAGPRVRQGALPAGGRGGPGRAGRRAIRSRPAAAGRSDPGRSTAWPG